MDLILNPTSTMSITVRCRVRGRGPVEIELPVGGDVEADVTRSVLELLLLGAGAPVPPELSCELAEELAAAGLLISPAERTPPDPDYVCAIDAEVPALLPQAAAPSLASLSSLSSLSSRSSPSASSTRTAPLEAAPDLRFGDDVPDVPLADTFAPVANTVWARDPGPQTWMPYALDDSTLAILRAIAVGEPVPARAHPQQLSSLALAHLVGPRGFAEQRRSEWQREISAARQQLTDDGYVVFRDFLNPLEVAATRRYHRALHTAEAFVRGDRQVEHRDWMHDEAYARFMHRRVLQTVNALTPDPLKPSYAYTARYWPGAVLHRHTDRPQCEWNVSLVLDTSPEVDRDGAWPIHLDAPGGRAQVRLAMGDFVLYRGTRLPHWREAQPEGRFTTVCFFHFVGVDFIGSLA